MNERASERTNGRKNEHSTAVQTTTESCLRDSRKMEKFEYLMRTISRGARLVTPNSDWPKDSWVPAPRCAEGQC